MPPRISFIVPCYNEEKHIRRCIGSIIRSAAGIEYEIIAVDNNSTDATPEIAASLDVMVLKSIKRGASASRNLGASKAQGQWLAFVDADCILDPEWVTQLSSLLSQPNVAAVAANAAGPVNEMTWVEKGWADMFVYQIGLSPQGIRKVSNLASCNMLIPSDLFKRVGGFDEALLSCEDYDISRRLAQHGDLLRDENLRVIHLRESKTLCEFFFREVSRGRYSLRCFAKNGYYFEEIPSIVIPLASLALAISAVISLGFQRLQLALSCFAGLGVIPCIYLIRGSARYRSITRFLRNYTLAATYVAAKAISTIKETWDLAKSLAQS